MKIKKIGKPEASLYDKTEYVIHIRNLKRASDHRLVWKNVQSAIKFNQSAWLIPDIDINTNLRKKAQNDFEKYFFKLINNAAFVKTMENIGKDRDIQLVSAESRRIYFVSEPNYHTKKFFISNRNEKTEILMNKRIYLGLSIL